MIQLVMRPLIHLDEVHGGPLFYYGLMTVILSSWGSDRSMYMVAAGKKHHGFYQSPYQQPQCISMRALWFLSDSISSIVIF